MPDLVPKCDASHPRWSQLSGKARLLVLVTKFVFLIICLEIASRAYWQFVHKVPAFRTRAIWNKSYELFDAVANAPAAEDETFEVLVLGPSVLNTKFCDAAERIGKGISDKLERPVRVSNLSYPGHTSRDALLQFRRLGDRKFDFVLFYHGINDQHLNNIPADRYRADYTHASRYRHLASLEWHAEHPYFVLPYTTRYLVGRWEEQLRLRPQPGKNFLAEGEDLKTPPAFRDNVEEILTLCRERKSRLAVVTFALYIADNYTTEAFAAQKLDYDRHVSPLSYWGTTSSVARGIAAHNDVLRDVARRNSDVVLADIAGRMPKGKANYEDPCHFTAAGSAAFAELVLGELTLDEIRMP